MKTKFILFLIACSVSAFSQSGYKINFKIKGWKNNAAYLGTYYGETTGIKDTAQVNPSGEFTFDNKTSLAQGVYMLVVKNKSLSKIFDFVVSDDQFFSLETDTSDFVQHMKVIGDEDNKLFFENIAYNIERNKEAESIMKIVKDSTLKEDQKKEARAGLNKLNDKVLAHQKDVISKYPKTMTARLLKTSQIVAIPDPPKLPNGKIDSTFQLKYYRQHFFDNFDLSDDALLHLPQPLYEQKIKEYLEKLFTPQPDSVTKAIDGLVDKAKSNKETYNYLVRSCLIHYQQPEIMGLDEVFVNVYDKYFATGEMDSWANAKTKQNLKEIADKIRSCMIGHTGANLIMQDQNFQPKSMYDIKAKYTILFIFKPSCGHCREETPKLVDFYIKNKTKYNFEVFAVATDTSMKEMRAFIKEFKTPWITVDGPRFYVNEQKEHFSKLYNSDTTPTIFVLDDKKKIIAKKIGVGQLDDFLMKHEKFLQLKKPADASSGSKGTTGQ
jgi:thiol-disulfide isomerase/thioredoxin